MLNAYILRGLPGSGKSTLAAQLQPISKHVHSTDKYFMDEHGEYLFEPAKLRENHEKNKAAFKDDCENHVQTVVLDNTNSQLWEYADYALIATAEGYTVHHITVDRPKHEEHVALCAQRNIHGVPLEVIMKMSKRFEI